jgi:D-arabinose 1-dehydrogenase-like Zn-dependent alcohol dehydrogenase
VFDLIERNANLHGVSVGSAEGFAQMMNFVAEHALQPVIDKTYSLEDAGEALRDIVKGAHFGKLVVSI